MRLTVERRRRAAPSSAAAAGTPAATAPAGRRTWSPVGHAAYPEPTPSNAGSVAGSGPGAGMSWCPRSWSRTVRRSLPSSPAPASPPRPARSCRARRSSRHRSRPRDRGSSRCSGGYCTGRRNSRGSVLRRSTRVRATGDAVAQGFADDFHPALGAELGQDPGDVGLHGPTGQEHAPGDVRRRVAPGDQGGDLDLGRCEGLPAGRRARPASAPDAAR